MSFAPGRPFFSSAHSSLFDRRLQYLCCHFFVQKTSTKGLMPAPYVCILLSLELGYDCPLAHVSLVKCNRLLLYGFLIRCNLCLFCCSDSTSDIFRAKANMQEMFKLFHLQIQPSPHGENACVQYLMYSYTLTLSYMECFLLRCCRC
jgi:hypothetical protein